MEEELRELRQAVSSGKDVDELLANYHKLIEEASESIIGEETPDEVIKKLHRKEY